MTTYKSMHYPQSIVNFVGLTSSCLLLPFAATAAGAPDAGAIQQQFEQTLKQPTPSASPPVRATGVAPASTSGTQIMVSGFDFVGNTLVSSVTLEEGTRRFLNRSLSLNELRAATDAVQQLYREAGWMVRAVLPAQEVQNGRVKIEITEARLGKVVLTGEAKRVQASVIEGMISQQLQPGAPIPQAGLERALMLLTDLPGMTPSASFAQGAQPGQTDLVMDVQDKPLLNGLVSLDNMGSPSTGTIRLLGTVNVNSPLQIGDLLSVTGLKTEGSHYARAAYSLLAGHDGWRIGLQASDVGYSFFKDGGFFSGTARTHGLSTTYPLVRRQLQTLALNGSWDEKSFRNDGGQPSDYGIRVGNLALTANAQDNWAGGGISNASVQWSSGRVSPHTQVLDATTQGQFSKWLITAGRVQALGQGLNLYVTGQVQRANKTLDSSEKLYLGGAYGVRAYPGTEGAASEGESLSLELSQRVQEGLNLNGFYDWARARNPQDLQAALRDYKLRGYGVSATWQAASRLQIKASAARRIGDAPQSNNTFGASRLWLSATYSF